MASEVVFKKWSLRWSCNKSCHSLPTSGTLVSPFDFCHTASLTTKMRDLPFLKVSLDFHNYHHIFSCLPLLSSGWQYQNSPQLHCGSPWHPPCNSSQQPGQISRFFLPPTHPLFFFLRSTCTRNEGMAKYLTFFFYGSMKKVISNPLAKIKMLYSSVLTAEMQLATWFESDWVQGWLTLLLSPITEILKVSLSFSGLEQ